MKDLFHGGKFEIRYIRYRCKTASASSIAFAILRGIQLSRLKKVAQPTYIDTYIYVRMCVYVCMRGMCMCVCMYHHYFIFFFRSSFFFFLGYSGCYHLSFISSFSSFSFSSSSSFCYAGTYSRYKYKSQANIS